MIVDGSIGTLGNNTFFVFFHVFDLCCFSQK
jgi:hypothetical protein